jgi:phosphoglycerate dehydrogenase-like enzyme
MRQNLQWGMGVVAAAWLCLAGGVCAAQPVGTAEVAGAAEEIGSLRGAQVAYPMEAGARPELLFIGGNLSDAQIAELQELAPNVRVLSARSRDEALAHAAGAHGVDGRWASEEFVAKAGELVWVQSPSAGVERYLGNAGIMGDDRVVLTNMRAVHGPAIADHAFAMLLTLTWSMPAHLENQREGRWGGGGARGGSIALEGRTMFVVGLGGIGTEIAQRAHGFGMRVIGSRRSDAPAPEYVERVGRPEELHEMLGEADVVAVCVPLTPETEGMFNADAFGAMKEGAYLINIARGRIVETDALVAALESGRLAGACLDVTDPEPLPEGHALWAMENVVITPHTAADAPETDERWWALFRENVRRFGAGEPLLNTVDKGAGY